MNLVTRLPIRDIAVGCDCRGIERHPFEKLIGAHTPGDQHVEKVGTSDYLRY
jgi:hypothetical protein